MCVTKRFTERNTMTEGLKGGATCSHRCKKSLFQLKEIKKKLKLKMITRACEACSRDKQGSSSESPGMLICTKCAFVGCDKHSAEHCTASRSEEAHALNLNLETIILRCHPCDADLQPFDGDTADPVKGWYDEIKSFMKQKTVAPLTKKEEEKPRVEGKPVIPAPQTEGQCIVPKKEKPENEKRNGYTRIKDFTLAAKSSSDIIPAKGLANLGNTCFFNSVMQCIMHTHHLQYYFERFGRLTALKFADVETVTVNEEKVDLEPMITPVEVTDAPMNLALRGFLSEFRCGTSPSPSNMFGQIARKAPRFKGWQQQDAHELLRYLLDGLRSEEMDWYKAAISHYYKLSPTANPKKVDPAVLKTMKGYLQRAGRALLDSVFGGTLLQTIRCSQCGYVSSRNEQFLDLSIPISSNPMSAARAPAGKNPGQLSAHQKKKAEKLAKKNKQKMARQKATNGNGSQNGDKNISDEDDQLADELEDFELSDEESDGDGLIYGDPHDQTKALVPPPEEYSQYKNLGSCLLEFTAEERLAGPNAYECEKCCAPINKKLDKKGPQKKRVEALKRYLIYEPPAVLTMQLKRFQQVAGYTGRMSTRKLGGRVDFPLLFDIAPFCCKNVERINPGQTTIKYSLYGVVVHSGDLGGGHYIAYVKSRHRVPHVFAFLEKARAGCVDANSFPVDNAADGVSNDEASSPDGQWYYCSDTQVRAAGEAQVLGCEAYILFYERIQ